MYRPQKPPRTEVDILWERLNRCASEYDVEVEDHDEAFFLGAHQLRKGIDCLYTM